MLPELLPEVERSAVIGYSCLDQPIDFLNSAFALSLIRLPQLQRKLRGQSKTRAQY